MRLNLVKLRYAQKEYDKTAAAAEQLLAAQPGSVEALLLLSESRKAQGRSADALAAIQRAISVRRAAGQKADEAWYKQAIAIAYEEKMPAVTGIARDWVAAYPSAQSWSDALRIYRNIMKPDEPTLLDALRLGRVTNSLSSENEFHGYAYTAIDAYAVHEARSVLDEGIAANKIDRKSALIQEIDAAVASKMANVTREGLATAAKEVSTDPSARFAVRIADAHYGLGDYGKAAELYKAALGKTGSDANLINLRLGMALARAGDKAGATAALNAVTGPRAELAKFWLLYLAMAA
jgi:predicted Zn-dependent protease